ncbi:MAG: IS481 family transposase, partial [Thermoplasmata archaeon]
MRKLTRRKLRWLIREMEKGEASAYQLARIQKISERWVWELYRRYSERGEYPYPKKPGASPKPITDEEREYVMRARARHPASGAFTLEKAIEGEEGIHIPH